jgi:deoxyribonuclease IV
MIRIGLKVFSTNDAYIAPAERLFSEGVFDYAEVYLVAGKSRNSIKNWISSGIPLAFHAPHSIGGFNPSQASARKANEIIAQEIADVSSLYKPLYLVFHAGTDGSLKESICQFSDYLSKFPHIRETAIIENKPVVGMYNMRCIGTTSEEIKQIMTETTMGFCLDFGHAICAAKSLNIDRQLFIHNFLSLNPSVFHVSDGHVNSEEDEHLHLGVGDYNLSWIISCIPQKATVAIETQKDSNDSLDDFALDAHTFRYAENRNGGIY